MAPGWDGLLYVADMEKGLWVVDPVTGAIRDLIPLEGVTPVDVAVGPDGETFYIADQAANAIAIFNITTRELIGQIGAGEFEPLMPGSVAVSWNGEVYASNGTAQVKIFGPDGALIGVVNMTDFADVTGPCPIAISPDGSIFAGCWGGEIVHLSATGESLGWVQAPELEAGGVTAITVALDMTVVLATSEGIVKVDPDTGEVLARYGGPTEGYPYCQGCLYAPYGLAAFLDGSIIYTDANQRAGAAIISAFFYP
jgi:sugar lactone lactonase YvrE